MTRSQLRRGKRSPQTRLSLNLMSIELKSQLKLSQRIILNLGYKKVNYFERFKIKCFDKNRLKSRFFWYSFGEIFAIDGRVREGQLRFID